MQHAHPSGRRLCLSSAGCQLVPCATRCLDRAKPGPEPACPPSEAEQTPRRPGLTAPAGAQLPLGEAHAGTRRAALAVLRALLARGPAGANGGGAARAPDGAFVREALGWLAAPEVVQLGDWVEATRDGGPTPAW
jgi:hypothetical protein